VAGEPGVYCILVAAQLASGQLREAVA